MDNYGGGGDGYGHENYDYEASQQRPPPSKYQVRPKVDADAEGEVDPSLWVFYNLLTYEEVLKCTKTCYYVWWTPTFSSVKVFMSEYEGILTRRKS